MALSDRSLAQAVRMVAEVASAALLKLWESLSGSPAQRRAAFMEQAPEVVAEFADAAMSLAADYYDDLRDESDRADAFTAQPGDTGDQFARDVEWATRAAESVEDVTADVQARIARVVELEIRRASRETVRQNALRDPGAAGWRRLTHGDTCKLCAMLAERGAVYKQGTATFAAHTDCDCTAQPVFKGPNGEEYGQEADVMQYVASKRRRTKAQRVALREHLNENFPDHRG